LKHTPEKRRRPDEGGGYVEKNEMEEGNADLKAKNGGVCTVERVKRRNRDRKQFSGRLGRKKGLLESNMAPLAG